MISNSQIIASANVTDPERFRYEVESHTRYNGDYEFGYGFYPKGQFKYSYHAKAIVLFSSLYSPIAKFKLKAWK